MEWDKLLASLDMILCKAQEVGTHKWVIGYVVARTDILENASKIPFRYFEGDDDRLGKWTTVYYRSICTFSGIKDKKGTKLFNHDFFRNSDGELLLLRYDPNRFEQVAISTTRYNDTTPAHHLQYNQELEYLGNELDDEYGSKTEVGIFYHKEREAIDRNE